jgi:hypothetical protein
MTTTFARGVAKTLALAEEASFGVKSTAAGSYLRRTSSDLTLSTDAYQSQEILPSQQVEDLRLGVRRVSGTLSGQLSPGAYADLFQGMMRGTWAAKVQLTGQIVTLSALSNGGTAINASAGGFLASGLKIGDVIVLTGFSGGYTANNGVNCRIFAMTDTTISVYEALTVVSSAVSGITISQAGKKLLMAGSNQLFRSYTLEHWFADVGISEAFVGCRISQISLNIPATGLVTFSATVTGQDMITGSSQVYSTPAGPTTDNSLAAVSGKIAYNGAALGIITGMSLQLTANVQSNPVLGSNTVPEIFMGMMRVNGSFTAMFTDETLETNFITETETTLHAYLTSTQAANSDFISFFVPRVKAMSAQKSDSDMSLIQSFNFSGLYQTAGGAGTALDATSISIMDSAVPSWIGA